jgi:hypothetical protein
MITGWAAQVLPGERQGLLWAVLTKSCAGHGLCWPLTALVKGWAAHVLPGERQGLLRAMLTKGPACHGLG